MLPGWRKEEDHQDPSDLCFVWACHLQHLVKLSSLKQFLPLMIHFFLCKKSSSLKSCQQYCILHLKPLFSALFSLGGSLPYWRNALRRFTLTIFGQPWLQVTSRVTLPVVFLVFLDTTLVEPAWLWNSFPEARNWKETESGLHHPKWGWNCSFPSQQTKKRVNIVMWGQFCTLAMFYIVI